MVALLLDVQEFIVGSHVWLVTSVCKVEGYIKNVNDFFVGIDCNL